MTIHHPMVLLQLLLAFLHNTLLLSLLILFFGYLKAERNEHFQLIQNSIIFRFVQSLLFLKEVVNQLSLIHI